MPDLDFWTSEQIVSVRNQLILSKSLLQRASNYLVRPTSVTDSVFTLAIVATLIELAQCRLISAHVHNLPDRDYQHSRSRIELYIDVYTCTLIGAVEDIWYTGET